MKTQPQNPQPRSRTALAIELRKVANGPSRDFWLFWRGMSKQERLALMNWAEEPAPVGIRQ